MSSEDSERTQTGKSIPLGWAIVPILALIGFLVGVLVVLPRVYAGFSLEGHLPLAIGACIAGLVARRFGYRWEQLQLGILNVIKMAMPAILILYVIGLLIGVWMIAGIVPAMISWGLELLAPAYFLPASCLVCAAVSLVTGSSWSTAGTVGVALIGVGQALGIEPGYAAGAVISGAYFGDKLSPMSETTNLSPAMAGADLFVHIRSMLWTTLPSLAIALVVYLILSANLDATSTASSVEMIQSAIALRFSPSILHILAPATVLVLVARKQPALPSLLAGSLVAVLIALFQGETIADVLTSAMSGFSPNTGNASVDKLLKRGGMSSVNNTVLLILCAMSFGGVMESTGMLQRLAQRILSAAKSARSLIISTVCTSIGLNILAADQYISIVVPGRMYAQAYRDRNLAPQNLSRALEDGGTMTSALVPWNSCGAYMADTLGVATIAYAPFAVVNWVNPLVAIALALWGKGIVRSAQMKIEERDDVSSTPTV